MSFIHFHVPAGGKHHENQTGAEVTELDTYNPVRLDFEILDTAGASLCPWDFVVTTVILPTAVHRGHNQSPTYRQVVLHEARQLTAGCTGHNNCADKCSLLGPHFACEAVYYSLPVDERHDFSVRIAVGFTCARQQL